MKREDIILDALETMYPNAHVELNHKNIFELLVAVVLSAQTTDKSVNKITGALFEKFPTPYALKDASLDEVENLIKSIGLYKNKAKNIIALSNELVFKFNGEIPSDRSSLESLSGVGRKTANVVLSNAFGIPALAVDTHVNRVSKRLKLAKENDSVLQVEQKLMKKFPEKYWTKLHHQLIFFGRYHCLSQNPKCYNCPLFDICSYKNKDKLK
jgi:endonuclease-3